MLQLMDTSLPDTIVYTNVVFGYEPPLHLRVGNVRDPFRICIVDWDLFVVCLYMGVPVWPTMKQKGFMHGACRNTHQKSVA